MDSESGSESDFEPNSSNPPIHLPTARVSISTSKDTRPEFIPFTAPHLSSKFVYNDSQEQCSFYDFPERSGWMFDYNHKRKGRYPLRIFPRHHREVPQAVIDRRKPCEALAVRCYRIDAVDAPIADQVAFLQAWLFFGILTEVSTICGLDIDIEAEFLICDGTSNLISTVALNGLPQRWLEAAKMQALGNLEERLQQVAWIIEHVTWLNDGRDAGGSELSYLECKALFAIEILLRIVILMLKMSGFSDQKIMGLQFGLLAGFPLHLRELSVFAREELVQKGWCKSEVAMFNTVSGREPDGPPYEFFATALERNHMDHTKCDASRCLADQIDDETYETVHVEAGCRCGAVRVRGEDLAVMLGNGNVPRISISDDLKLAVVCDGPYVAISHVWSHGIGNPIENALPKCQIRRLYDYVANLSSPNQSRRPLALWIDTLCIPVAPHLKQYRKKAITLLAQVYDDAIVLVLDRELSAHSSHRMSLLEQSIRILTSGWMRRLWTLQEAILARNLFFQLRDVATPFPRPEILPGPNFLNNLHQPGTSERTLLFNELENFLNSSRIPTVMYFRNPPSAYNWAGSRYKNMISCAQYRSTSKTADEPMILAIIMGMGVKDFLDSSQQEKNMARFHMLVGRIPGDIIFLDLNGKNLKLAPFRWAPATLLESEIQSLSLETEHPLATCDQKGLHVVYGAFIFPETASGRNLPMQFCIRERTQRYQYMVSVKSPCNLVLPQRPAMIMRGRGDDAIIVDIMDKDEDEETPVTIVGYVSFGGYSNAAEPLLEEIIEVDKNQGPGWSKWCVT